MIFCPKSPQEAASGPPGTQVLDSPEPTLPGHVACMEKSPAPEVRYGVDVIFSKKDGYTLNRRWKPTVDFRHITQQQLFYELSLAAPPDAIAVLLETPAGVYREEIRIDDSHAFNIMRTRFCQKMDLFMKDYENGGLQQHVVLEICIEPLGCQIELWLV